MLRLHGRANSSNVQKVLWCCAELGLAYQRTDVGGAFGGTDTPEYGAMNPNRLVPTIDDDGFVLWESNTIVRYLAARYGAGSLCPADLQVRATAEMWMDWQLTTLGPVFLPVFLGLVRTPPERRDVAAIKAGRDKSSQALAVLDAALADRAFVAGADFTMGDIPLGIAAYRWFVLDIEREDYPNLRRWYDALSARPGFRQHVMQPLT